MKLLTLSNSSLEAIVDNEDYDRCLGRSWSLMHKELDIARFQIRCRFKGKKVNLSNFIMKDFRSMFDHKNRNGLDNRKENLRLCTRSQNTVNREKSDGVFSSKYKGVC